MEGDEWRLWYTADRPEMIQVPGTWGDKLDDMQRLCLLRAARPDRILFAAATFVANALGKPFVDPPPFDLAEVCSQAACGLPDFLMWRSMEEQRSSEPTFRCCMDAL